VDHGIANVIVWLDEKANATVHPSFDSSASTEAIITSRDCRFEPHILVMRPTQPFVWLNRDEVGHSFRANPRLNETSDILSRPGGRVERRFAKSEDEPASVVCNIHPYMRGYLFVHKSPYVAVSDSHGQTQLRNLPVGKHDFRVWHERIDRPGKRAASWAGSRMEIEIHPGENDRGEAKLKPALFEM